MPLQKSYSERIGLSKVNNPLPSFGVFFKNGSQNSGKMQQRSPWRRSRTHPAKNEPDPRPLVPVSEVTKNKLSKFQYQKREAENEEEENKKAEGGAVSADDQPSKGNGKEVAVTATPANRLTWRDFMAPATSVEEDTNVSPNERIMWDSKPDKLYANAFSPVMARKGRKRARSSSPISSPVGGGGVTNKSPAVNVKKLAQALRSPHTDPTLELWDRYSLSKAGGQVTPVGLDNPALAQLIISSSPGPSKETTTADHENYLRRAVSQGLHGPKRRKIEKTRSFTGAIDSQREMEAASKSSLVTHLLDSVNSSIQEPGTRDPIPQADPAELLTGSPSHKKRMRESTAPSVQPQVPIDEFSDFGDDDFDDDTLLELEANINEPSQGKESKTEENPKGKTAGDSFDGLDDDVFADADALVAEAQTEKSPREPSPRKAAPGPNRKMPIQAAISAPGGDDFDDEFGDLDDDDIDFDAVELAATHDQCPGRGLVSSTVIADSFSCMRRAVLQERVKASSDATPPLIYGTILHEIFQEALLANKWNRPFLSKLIVKITENHVEDLYMIKVSMALAREHLESKMAELSHWASAFVASEPRPDGIVEDRGGKKGNIAVTKLLDVEEHVWSPTYGIKGNIDATIEIAAMDGNDKRRLTVPFEVKTGKHPSPNHIAQTVLYTLLLSDRYDINIAYGILYYMESSRTMRVPAIRNELRHMIMQRNELACHIRERSVHLPAMFRNKHVCGKCYAKISCFTYHRLADDGDGETSDMQEKFEEIVGHLTPKHQEFFVKWENLLTKEEKDSQKTKRELWTMTSAEREKKSRCFADVIIEEGSASEDTENPRINRFNYTFIKHHHASGFSFLESELTVGDPIVVSDEEGHFALAIGYVTAVRRQRISVAVDRRLHNARIRQPGFDEVNNQTFASIMEVAPEGSTSDASRGKIKREPIRYRLDQDEFSNSMATVRNNLVQIMSDQVPQMTKVRNLVVDLAPPQFKPVATQYTVSDKGENLNVDQKGAIEKVMSARDYALVLGMPGTGKTTTIAHIIRALTQQGKSVLLTSHTHTAVDNILLKLKSDNIPILRLGAPAKIHPEVQDFATLASLPKTTFDEIKQAWHGTPIVATTCLGINHRIFQERSFDYCIVDEASQITLPICVGPILKANTFVLVGDHNQLPPVVRNEEAREGGLDISLFKLLSDSHPESVINLEHQYRMCEDIMMLSNTLIYDGKLRCGTEALRRHKLHVPRMEALRLRHHDVATLASLGPEIYSICAGPTPSRCWLRDLLDSEARVRFVNTDTLQPQVREEAHGKRIVNPAEVRVVSQLVESLLTVGVPDNEIGVMTHYRAQLFLLKERLRVHSGVEMHTTDRFQGRDKEVIVLSLVRSNDACNIGDLLRDWRRINVAFTRAKTKLLVVGSLDTLKGSGHESMLSRFISLMEDRDWIYNLPPDALESHYFEEPGTQITATASSPRSSRKPNKKMGASPKKSPVRRGDLATATSPGKENRPPGQQQPRRATMGERVLLKDKLITRDILNEITNGAY
ncbi:DNA replication ATP-dependent helicase Dna2 [Geosmithia morbida]|uniref:DNA replication ATP-dependent helicase/nuclease n=1 Tax=Geosmithia morbida TaxID=1094350 RepID=A0A9P4YYZ9_9HYPO|nr:DNA replication ATP-dependent helicase Dna2 [Geosmithia morbida]KAF4124374.1 DNA replication ATP-dependent helicase Dna2 [Geosmithia morbida]